MLYLLTFIMCTSILCHLFACYFSFRLIKVTKSRTAWLLISLSILVQIIRRSFTLVSVLTGQLPVYSSQLYAEIIALVVSLLLLFGTAKIAPLFLSIRNSEESLRIAKDALFKAHNELEKKVAERTLELNKVNEQLRNEIIEHKKSEENLRKSLQELKQTQDALISKDRQAVIGQMAAGMAHEVKNPLTAVRGFAQILEEKVSPDNNLNKYAHIIIEEVDAASSVINDFLRLSQPSHPLLESHSLGTLVKDIVTLVKPQALLKNIQIECQSLKIPSSCFIDGKQIKQVLLNICQNAIESMPNGGYLFITVAYENEHFCITVSDTGSGMSEDTIKNIFVPFFTTKNSGTGLGMFVCQSIIGAHKGKIQVLSKEGIGTHCMLYLPHYTDAATEYFETTASA